MRSVKYLIVGGGLAGSKAVEGIRKVDQQGSILLVAAEPHLPYDRPPLTKDYMQGKQPAEKGFLHDAAFYTQNNAEVLLATSVTSLNPAAHTAGLSTGDALRWERCLLATGGRPRLLDVPGARLENVFYMRTLDDAVALSAAVRPGVRAVVIGAGFIGMELASSLTQRGMAVALVHPQERVWTAFAPQQLGAFFQDACIAKGVEFFGGERVAAIDGTSRASAVITQAGRRIPADVVCIAVGIDLNTELARQGGLAIDNGVIVDEHLASSCPDIFCAGDIANYPDPHFGRRRRVEHWGQADYTGELAGRNMAGAGEAYNLLTYVWSDIFDLHLEFAGDEKQTQSTILRGDPQARSFSILCMAGGRMTAFYCVNVKRGVFKHFNSLIEKKIDLTGKEAMLADANYNPAQLVGA